MISNYYALLPLISLIMLSACTNLQSNVKERVNKEKLATNLTANRLNKEAINYQYSRYVQQNLTPQKRPPATVVRYSTQNRQSYTAQQLQLKQRKKRSHAHIRTAVMQNDLHTPSLAFQRELSTLRGRTASLSWLEKHPSLAGVLALALKNNLDIKTQQQNALSNLSKYDQVSYLDDMLFQYNAFTTDLTLTGSTQKHNRSAASGFPFSGLRGLKARIIEQRIEVVRTQLKQAVQDVITQTRNAYYELQYSQHNINLTREMGKLLTSLQQQLKSNYSVNSTKLSDILQVYIEIEENKNDVQIAKDKQQAQQARLNALLNLPSRFRLAKLEPLTPLSLPKNSDSLIQTAKKKRIEIATLRAQLEKMQRVIRLSERRFYPDFDAGYSRFQNSASKQVGSTANRATFSTRPKIKSNHFFATNDAYLAESKEKIKTLKTKINALQTQTEDDLQQAYTRYQSQQRNYVLYQTKILPKAKTALEIAKNNFETGDSSFLDIMQAQESIFRYRLLAFRAIKDINKQVATIRRITGSR